MQTLLEKATAHAAAIEERLNAIRGHVAPEAAPGDARAQVGLGPAELAFVGPVYVLPSRSPSGKGFFASTVVSMHLVSLICAATGE